MTTTKTTIGTETKIEGVVQSGDDLVIRGSVRGGIVGRGMVLVEEPAMVVADIRASSAEVSGTVRGDIVADERVELHPEARVKGHLKAKRILIADGAKFKGNVDMDQTGQGELDEEEREV